MSSNDGPDTGSNVFPFPRIGFTLTPTTGPANAPDTDGASTTTAPDWDAVTVTNNGRRSPLDALNALPDPGLTAPLVPYTSSPAPGTVPDTFRAEPAPDMVGPRLGALSLAAILAVAVAAMRGTATFLQERRQRHLARAEEAAPIREARLKHQLAMRQAGYDRQLSGAKHSAAMQGLGEKAAQQRAKTHSKVPSSSAFGSKALSGRSSSGSGSGSGRGKSTGTGSSSSGSGSSRHGSGSLKNRGGGAQGPKKKNSPLFGGGSGGSRSGSGGKGTGSGTGRNNGPKNQKGPKGPHRTSQGAGATLKKNSNGRGPAGKGTGGTGSGGRTTLPEALKKSTQKAAARRLKRRRKNPGTPVLWGSQGKPGGKNKQHPNNKANGTGKGKKSAQAAGGGKPANLNKPQTPGRTTLNQALRKAALKAARKRLKQRRRHPATPPIWGTGGNRQRNGAGNGPTQARKQRAKARANGKRQGAAWWANVRAKARRRTHNTRYNPGTGTQGPGPQHTAGGRGTRKSPFQNAGQAAAQAGTTYTVTSDHVPGSTTKPWEPDALTTGTPALPATGPAALDPAPTTTFPRPGTTRPKEARPMPPSPAHRPDPRITKARNQAARTGYLVTEQARHMDPMHETEITLDDAIEEYGDFKDDAFKTHDKCFKLAERARTLRDTLALLALELSQKHNLIGALFTAAMARLSESMDLLARMADEMQTSSLEAAEMAEAADNDLNDAYRPYSTATADAGLSTPSAPVHNET